MKKFDLTNNHRDFPLAMAEATRLGSSHALVQKPRIRNTREMTDMIAPGCANGYATPLKQAYNGGYWAGEMVVKGTV